MTKHGQVLAAVDLLQDGCLLTLVGVLINLLLWWGRPIGWIALGSAGTLGFLIWRLHVLQVTARAEIEAADKEGYDVYPC
jgi:hypothetical protein